MVLVSGAAPHRGKNGGRRPTSIDTRPASAGHDVPMASHTFTAKEALDSRTACCSSCSFVTANSLSASPVRSYRMLQDATWPGPICWVLL